MELSNKRLMDFEEVYVTPTQPHPHPRKKKKKKLAAKPRFCEGSSLVILSREQAFREVKAVGRGMGLERTADVASFFPTAQPRFLCVCICVWCVWACGCVPDCEHTCACRCLCTCVWRPEVAVRCLPSTTSPSYI